MQTMHSGTGCKSRTVLAAVTRYSGRCSLMKIGKDNAIIREKSEYRALNK